MATITIRCDEKDKREAQEVAEYYGFNLSSVTRAFWKQMARTHSIPSELCVGEEPNDESMASIQEPQEIIAEGGTGHSYSCTRELLENLPESHAELRRHHRVHV